jgi:hypothetical protein
MAPHERSLRQGQSMRSFCGMAGTPIPYFAQLPPLGLGRHLDVLAGHNFRPVAEVGVPGARLAAKMGFPDHGAV